MKTIEKKAGNRKSDRPNAIGGPESSGSGFSNLEQVKSKRKIPVREADTLSELIELKRIKVEHGQERHMVFSSLGLALSMLIVIGMFEWRQSDDLATVELSANMETFDDLMEIPQTEQTMAPPPQVQAPQIVEVSDEEIIEEVQVNLDIEMTEDTRVVEVIHSQAEAALPEEAAEEIFTIVEEQPVPGGGFQAFYQFVAENLKYPPRASRMGIEGRVFVQFVVEKDGSLTDIQVVRGIGGGCDEEAMRVISIAPKWNPGKQRGRPVRVRMVLPVVFKLLDNM
jgi:periplasmic protein TonB